MIDEPHQVVMHDPHECAGCGRGLDGIESSGDERRRQVVDVPPLALQVTEHRARTKKCEGCGHSTMATFPEEASVAGMSYGPRIKALGVYLMCYQLLPYERTRELLLDLFGAPAPGVGTLHAAMRKSSEGLGLVEERIKEGLRRARVVNFDETGLRVDDKRMWVHVSSTGSLTHYAVHPKRGSKATDEIGILPLFRGVAVHDGWAAYRNYEGCEHALCNAHHIRELTFVEEEHEQEWAGKMKRLLVEMERAVFEAASKGESSLSRERVLALERRYGELLVAGHEANPVLAKRRGKKGPAKKSKGKNLVERLENQRGWVLRFMRDFRVPFDNNQAERDVRMVKVRQKISGCFRTVGGAEAFLRIRGYISTVRKQGENVLASLEGVLMGDPFIPVLPG
jgi:transposase